MANAAMRSEAAEATSGQVWPGFFSASLADADPEVAAVENHVLAVLAGETVYEIDAATMRITAPNGVDGLGFTAR